MSPPCIIETPYMALSDMSFGYNVYFYKMTVFLFYHPCLASTCTKCFIIHVKTTNYSLWVIEHSYALCIIKETDKIADKRCL